MMVLKVFNEYNEKAKGTITLAFKLDDLITKSNFYIIDATIRSIFFYGDSRFLKNHVVPSCLHQCHKFMWEGVEHCIQGDLQPLSIHEIKIFQDASFTCQKM